MCLKMGRKRSGAKDCGRAPPICTPRIPSRHEYKTRTGRQDDHSTWQWSLYIDDVDRKPVLKLYKGE
ncbi:hypothetical protein LAB1_14090 [Roseibium sp. LAB1]